MTADSESAELRDMVARTFEQMGGRAEVGDVVATIRAIIPEHLIEYVLTKGLKSEVNRFFRTRNPDTGLPYAPAVDDFNTHVQLELLREEEYRYCVRRQLQAAEKSVARAEQYVAVCLELQGIDISDELEGRSAA